MYSDFKKIEQNKANNKSLGYIVLALIGGFLNKSLYVLLTCRTNQLS